MGVLELFVLCSGDIRWVSWRYLMDFLEVVDVVVSVISWVSLRFFMDFLEIFGGFP